MKRFKVDVEEVPEIIEAEDINEAIATLIQHVGLLEE